MLIYFSYRYTLFKINSLFGLLTFIIRFYLWLMLINVYTKSNIFAFGYLAAVVFFWFKEANFDLIRTINKAAIVLLCLQYIMLLLDINPLTSPLPLPYGRELSLLEWLISDPSVVSFLAVSSKSEVEDDSFLVSFVINSIIIFLTELCFTIYTILSELMMRNIFEIYLRYENILHKLSHISETDPVIINYNQYKHYSYRILNLFY